MFAVIPFDTRSEGKKDEENGECKNRALVVRMPSHEAFTSFYLCGDFSDELYLYSLPFFACTMWSF